jgi:nucleolar protein 9
MSLPKRVVRHQADPLTGREENVEKYEKFPSKSESEDSASFISEGALGSFSKGNRLTPETQSYFKEIQSALENLSKDDELSYHENLQLMLNNVFEEIKDKEYRLAVNPRCSKVLEYIFQFAKWSHLVPFFKKVQIFLFELMTDRCASHVIQALAKRFSELQEDGADDWDGISSMRDLLVESYEMLDLKWWDVACNVYGSHVLRTWIQQTKDLSSDLSVSVYLMKSLSAFSPSDVSSICCDMYGSPLLQVLIEAVVEHQEADGLMRKLSGEFSRISFDKFGSRVAEHVLKHSGNSVIREILEKEVLPNIRRFVEHQNANFVLQTALGNLRHVEHANLCVTAIAELDRGMVSSRRAGVLWKLAEACVNLQSVDAQKAFVTTFVGKSEDYIRKLIETNNHVNLMLAQSLLQFTSHNLQLVKDFSGLDDEALFKLAKSPSGSFVLQTFLQNKTIAEKTKNKILDKLKGKFAQIGQSPQGSRCLETCFEKASLTRKQAIAAELTSAENALKGTAFGRAVLSKLQIDLFKRDAKQWAEAQSKQGKAKALFSDIVSQDSNQSSKKSKKRKAEDDQGDEKRYSKKQKSKN